MEYAHILHKYANVFAHITLPRPRPISIEQTLRDIEPESFLVNEKMFSGPANNLNGLLDVLEDYVTKHFSLVASPPALDEDVRMDIVSAILQSSARTIAGGDAYFVVRNLLGNPNILIHPRDAHSKEPIRINFSHTYPAQVSIVVPSLFSFQNMSEIDQYVDTSRGTDSIVCLHTKHVQEYDFHEGRSSRYLVVTLEDER